MGVSQEEFRKALGHFATGVTVITVARGSGLVHGMTANAFASVSLQPPLVLVCVDHSAHTRPFLLEQKRFGVNVLRDDQAELSRYYAEAELKDEVAAELGVRYLYTDCGTPLLADSLARLECAVVATYEAGDHTIFLAEVEQASVEEARPLLFYRGKYHRLGAPSG